MSNHERLGWHFVGDTLRDGKPVPEDNVWAKLPRLHEFGRPAKIEVCSWGFHASDHPAWAMQYTGKCRSSEMLYLCRVKVAGDIDARLDKFAGRRRMILKRMEFSEPLLYFIRMTLLQRIGTSRFKVPDDLVDFLMTGSMIALHRAGPQILSWEYVDSYNVKYELYRVLRWFVRNCSLTAAMRLNQAAEAFAFTCMAKPGPGLYGEGLTAYREFGLFVEECFR